MHTGTGMENMANDLAMIEMLKDSTASSLWRLYTWKPWAVSLGKHQSLDAINLSEAVARGIDVVHRPTGGRAVLHANELTYCVVARGASSDVYATVHEHIHKALCSILGDKASRLQFEKVGADFRSHYASGSDMGQACFATSAKSEIMVQGRKVVGSAQRVMDNIVLQHGSILCGPGHLLLSELVNIPDSRRSVFKTVLERSSITMSDVAGHDVTPNDIACAISQNPNVLLV